MFQISPVGIAPCFGAENREYQAEEESHETQADDRHNPSFSYVTLS